MDPVTMLLIAGAILQVWTAVHSAMTAKTPEERDQALKDLDAQWAAARGLLDPHVAGAKARLEALARGEKPYA